MISVSPLELTNLEEYAGEHGIDLPLEQTPLWQEYDQTIPGRKFWGALKITENQEAIGLVVFMKYTTHGFSFLRAHHGPVYKEKPSKELELEVVEALKQFVKEKDSSIVFLRIGVLHSLPLTSPVLSTTPYNETVIVDISSGDEEEILATFKSRGRRDSRKSKRETLATYKDETPQGTKDFSEYYEVYKETASRDGFHLAPQKDYEDFLCILGPEHARLYAARVQGKVVSWTIATIYGDKAIRFYGASVNNRENRSVDYGILYESVELAKRGAKTYDMMGIGNDSYPALKSLREFKTKFSNETVFLAPDRDVPLKRCFYRLLKIAKKIKS